MKHKSNNIYKCFMWDCAHWNDDPVQKQLREAISTQHVV